MIDKNNISMSVVRRLPIYYRYLTELENKGITRISSKELSAKMGTTASQIRQDFSYFEGFGQQGYGYVVPQLRKTIAEILGVRKKRKCILCYIVCYQQRQRCKTNHHYRNSRMNG